MVTSRALWMSIVVGVALAGALPGCVSINEPPAAAGAQCYWLSNQGEGWVARPDLSDAGRCFEMDSCSGGGGASGGGCYKWAAGADAPATPWTELGLAPLSPPTPQASGADTPPPQDIYAGSYEMTSDCPEQGCSYGPARFSVATPLYARQDARSEIVATIPANECVLNTGRDALLSAPRRGVVLETRGRFTAGDVIYMTNYEGEGFFSMWWRGAYYSSADEEVAVRWDDEGPTDPREGYWLEVARANGQRGWARDAAVDERDCPFARR